MIVRYANGLSGRSQKPVIVSSNLTRTTEIYRRGDVGVSV